LSFEIRFNIVNVFFNPIGTYFLKLQALKNGTKLPDEKKKQQPIAKQSQKMKQQKKAEKPDRDAKEVWFAEINNKLTGFCGCGCGEKSSKNDPVYFRHSCAHIFPKNIFKSIRFDPLNYVERNYHNGCHTNMDSRSMDHWPNMEDWETIKDRFRSLAPKLTKAERAHKFYAHLERLIREDSQSVRW